MPLFEYHCADCDADVELLIRGGEQPHCPTCEGDRLEKLLSVPAAHSGTSLSVADNWAGPCGQGGCGRPECEI